MNCSEIGLIPETPATYDDEGNELTETVYKDGWHVNTLEPVPEWEAYKVPTPAKPYRMYAGGVMPVCYIFPDEMAFKKLFPDKSEDLA